MLYIVFPSFTYKDKSGSSGALVVSSISLSLASKFTFYLDTFNLESLAKAPLPILKGAKLILLLLFSSSKSLPKSYA